MAITRSPCTDPAGADPEAAPANLADALTRQAARTPAAPAVDVDGRVLAFQALESLVWKAAAALAGAGVRRGDVVAMACARPLPHLVSMLAVARLGATVLSIPSSAPHRQVLEQLDAAVATVLLRDAE
ncbi:MAG TPA: AMP-binding protein, partial [Quisquiliibacterium sp.]|nr:AMP-binding protein [Quisquiliibacterium sp.]